MDVDLILDFLYGGLGFSVGVFITHPEAKRLIKKIRKEGLTTKNHQKLNKLLKKVSQEQADKIMQQVNKIIRNEKSEEAGKKQRKPRQQGERVDPQEVYEAFGDENFDEAYWQHFNPNNYDDADENAENGNADEFSINDEYLNSTQN